MNEQGLWEQIYLRSLEIANIKRGDVASIEELVEHLTALDELIPAEVDPAEHFEVYVTARLHRAVNEVLLAFVARQRQAGSVAR